MSAYRPSSFDASHNAQFSLAYLALIYQTLRGLDLIRLFADLSVMLSHLLTSWASSSGVNHGVTNAPQYPEFDFLRIGWVGVETFYAVPGLVVTQSTELNSAYRVLRGRIGRLAPTAWIVATLTALAELWLGKIGLRTVLPNYFRTLVFILSTIKLDHYFSVSADGPGSAPHYY